MLLHDIADEDGNLRRLTDLKSDAGVAWQKVTSFSSVITDSPLIFLGACCVSRADSRVSGQDAS